MSLYANQTYRNHLGVVMVIKGSSAFTGRNTIGDIWVAESPDDLFGAQNYLVTEDGLRAAGYELEGVEP